TVRLAIHDDRFAMQFFIFEAGAEEYRRPLEPAHFIEGVVRYADTKKPVANARLAVYAGAEFGPYYGIDGRADAQGRFRLNPAPGNFFEVSAYPRDGEPYLAVQKSLKAPKASVKEEIDLDLPRGVLVRGKVAEARSGESVAGASLHFRPRGTD